MRKTLYFRDDIDLVYADCLQTKKPNETLDKLHDILYGGRSVKEICLALHNSVLAAEGLESKEKFKLLRIIGETEGGN